jgi:hypothetical protein
VTSVVAVIRLDFHRRRTAWRKSAREPVQIRADVGAEAWGDDIIVEGSESMEEVTTGNGPNLSPYVGWT